MNIRPCGTKTHADLVEEWDRLAPTRHRQISSGEDLSFDYVVSPMSLRLLERSNCTVVLDIGSGTGEFTVRLSHIADRVIGIEPSSASVAIAEQVCDERKNVKFLISPLEQAANSLRQERPTAAVAVMTLMTAPDLRDFAQALAILLPPGAAFAATLCHPWFWPKYWEYDSAPWFNYSTDIFIEAPFAISRSRTNMMTTHIHRPLERYVKVFSDVGFQLDAVEEPVPPEEVQNLYPTAWQFPRFLGLRWSKSA